jgi:hypothetical protein
MLSPYGGGNRNCEAEQRPKHDQQQQSNAGRAVHCPPLTALVSRVHAQRLDIDLLPFTIPGVAAIPNFIAVALVALCAVKIGVGRNWARWLMLVFFVLGFLTLPLAVMIEPQVLTSMPTLLVVFWFHPVRHSARCPSPGFHARIEDLV